MQILMRTKLARPLQGQISAGVVRTCARRFIPSDRPSSFARTDLRRGVIAQRCQRSGNTNTTRRIEILDRKSTRLNSSHVAISYAVFCLKKKKRVAKATD